MAKEFVKDVTSMQDDFAQWYTDVVTKATYRLFKCSRVYDFKTLRIRNMGEHSKGT